MEISDVAGCPACQGALDTSGEDKMPWRCLACGKRYGAEEGIPVLLRPEDVDRFAQLGAQYREARLQEGWQPLSTEQALALPYGRPPVSPSRDARLYWEVRRESFCLLMSILAREGPTPADGPAADLGAGTGWLSYRLAQLGYQVLAVDASRDEAFGLGAAAIIYASRVPFLSAQGDLEHPPLPAGALGLVLLNASLHYAADLEGTLRRAARALRPGGRLIILDTPISRWPHPGSGQGDRHLGREELQGALRQAGLQPRWLEVRRGWRWRLHQAKAWLRRNPRFSFPTIVAERLALDHPQAGSAEPAGPERKTVPNKRLRPRNIDIRIGSFRLLVACLLLGLLLGCRPEVREAEDLAPGHRFKATSDAVISSPIAYDFDGDGVKEIAVGSWDGYFYLLDAHLDDLPGWPHYSSKGFFSSPALADLDADGTPEILVGSEAGKLFAWHIDGESADGFPVDLGYSTWASPSVPDGLPIAIGGLEQMFLLDSQGQPLPGWPQPMQGWPDATAAHARDLLAVTTLTPGDESRGWLYAWGSDGGLLTGFPLELSMDSDSSPALAAFDGDCRWWIVFGDDAGWLHVVDLAGQEREGFPVRTLGPRPGPTPTPHPPGGNVYSIEASPAVADLDGDGRLEIAAGSWDGRMYVWDDNGQSLPGWPIAVDDQIISSAAIVDLDGDDSLDLVVGSKDGRLYGWTLEGRALPGFPYELGAPVFSSPWVGDLEGDGRADIAVGANNGLHLLAGVGPLGRGAWPMFHRDLGRSGAVPCR